ncbi:hypothetical protein AVEN_176086-1 [Araneus ventricosus]|uniref:Uncharacterized protein n=1 Tax=Araneus ventricosus TaxID=182803 RepID=A0A4Y2E850_ARAVE|nr:hypothetical protein AVEN_150618-1 [Araneus ventricosus]GBM24459.1 hypothetical protein AVEN_176086-1 [Araneus ventricosus]
MDSSAPFPLFFSLRVLEEVNGRAFISYLYSKGSLNDNSPNSPLSEKQPAEIRPTSIEVAWPVTGGLGVRVLKEFRDIPNVLYDVEIWSAAVIRKNACLCAVQSSTELDLMYSRGEERNI